MLCLPVSILLLQWWMQFHGWWDPSRTMQQGGQGKGSVIWINCFNKYLLAATILQSIKGKKKNPYRHSLSLPSCPNHSTFCLPFTPSHCYHQKLSRHSQSKSTRQRRGSIPTGKVECLARAYPPCLLPYFPIVSPISIQKPGSHPALTLQATCSTHHPVTWCSVESCSVQWANSHIAANPDTNILSTSLSKWECGSPLIINSSQSPSPKKLFPLSSPQFVEGHTCSQPPCKAWSYGHRTWPLLLCNPLPSPLDIVFWRSMPWAPVHLRLPQYAKLLLKIDDPGLSDPHLLTINDLHLLSISHNKATALKACFLDQEHPHHQELARNTNLRPTLNLLNQNL